jgi:hypothetical protein
MVANGRDNQLSVVLTPEQRSAVERVAAAEHRTVSAQIRHFVARALEEPSVVEKQVYGADCERSPVSGRIYEQGSGALSRDLQDKLNAEEARLGRRLTEFEASRLVHGDPVDRAAEDAAASIEKVVTE